MLFLQDQKTRRHRLLGVFQDQNFSKVCNVQGGKFQPEPLPSISLRVQKGLKDRPKASGQRDRSLDDELREIGSQPGFPGSPGFRVNPPGRPGFAGPIPKQVFT